jgi:hypothetical protein
MPPAPSHSCRPALAASAISPSVWCACRLSRARSPWSDHAGSARKARSALRVSASYWPAGRTRCARNGVQGDVPQASRISGCRQVCAVRLAAPVCGRARVKKSQAGSAGRVPGDVTVSEDEHVEVWEPRAGPFSRPFAAPVSCTTPKRIPSTSARATIGSRSLRAPWSLLPHTAMRRRALASNSYRGAHRSSRRRGLPDLRCPSLSTPGQEGPGARFGRCVRHQYQPRRHEPQ